MLASFLRRQLSWALTGRKETVLTNKITTPTELKQSFEKVEQFGIYIHIPFCRQICPYCPYNKEIFRPDLARLYAEAVKREIHYYSKIVGKRRVDSLYIGGGTPTTMLGTGLGDILEYLFKTFDVRCDIHMESHPNDLTDRNLDIIKSLGVKHLSMGVESLQDKHLKFLGRPYSVSDAQEGIRRTISRGFQCVNVDYMFDLPGQTCREVEEGAQALVKLGVDQVAAYPLFRFPYTVMGSSGEEPNFGLRTILKRRKMLRILEGVFYGAGFERTSVWAFTKRGVPRYCSVTVPLYLGLGASGGTYLKNLFYLNTFNVTEYIKAMAKGGPAIALSLDMTERMQMAGWLYWRIYETRFEKKGFQQRFGKGVDRVYGKFFQVLKVFNFLKEDRDWVVLTDKGSYWLHGLEDLFSIDYVSRLWGTAKQDPWPERVIL